MVINRSTLLCLAPIKNMLVTKHTAHGVSYGLTEAGYDIRIKQEVRFGRSWSNKRQIEIREGRHITEINDGRFALASSVEEFQMPLGLMAVVHDKSTWARRCLSVFNTVIEPGWKGHLTLELVYHGDEDLIIPAGAGIAQVIFQELAHPAQYEGKYQNQENEPVPARQS